MKIRVFAAAFLYVLVIGVQGAAAATTWLVDDDLVQCPTATYMSIQLAISAGTTLPGDTIQVCPGTYAGNLTLNKDLTLNGAKATVDAVGRVPTNESTITAVGTLLTLVTGSAGSTIDGFTFLGGTRGIESTSGPINDVQILNNRILGFTGSGLFLNDNGTNITIDQNDIDGTAKVGGGDLVHLDTDNFDGLFFTNNRVANGLTATGFFVDGSRNVDQGPGARRPLFSGNVIDRNQTGVNLGSRAWGDGDISGNTFSNNGFDGLQGGPRNTLITGNTFSGNGRNGLALTSFGNMAADRGAQNSSVTLNCFIGNGFTQLGAGILFSATQAPGTISTNEANQNNIVGNAMGARYPAPGMETIDATNNWWGAADGPGPPDGTGSGNGVDGRGFIVFTPFSGTGFAGTPCSGGPPTSLTLSPTTATNPVDTMHCVTATVNNAVGVPQANVTVRFTVTGAVNTTGSDTTDTTGQATFCYNGPALPGTDAITAFADTNSDGMLSPGEPSGAAAKIWVLPTTTPGCEIKITNGGWIIANNGDRANFGGNAVADEDGNVSGQEEYQDKGPVEPFNLHGNVVAILCDASDQTRASIFGEATIDGTGSHNYRIDVMDLAEPGKGADTYRMRVDAYDSGEQTLQGGNVQIHR